MKRLISFSIIGLMLSACATTANYEKMLDSWVGANVDDLVLRWGPPDKSFTFSSGGKVLEYARKRNIQLGGYTTTVPQTTYTSGVAGTVAYSSSSTTYVQQTTPVQNIAMQCLTRFTVTETGTIAKWAWEGNDCRAMEQK